MIFLKRTFLFLAFCFFLIKSTAQEQNNSLDILSWNIYMLPGIANLSKEIDKSDKKGRAFEIAQLVNGSPYEIIVFQEAFFNPARRILSKNIMEQYPYQYGPINPSKASLKTSSGIFVVSKIPLKIVDIIKFDACNGADCFAKKGAPLFQGEFQGNTFQLLGTHLNAGDPQWIREEQYKQMRQLLDNFKLLGVPQIVCGDMNTRQANEKDYNNMLKMLDVIDLETTSTQKTTTARGEGVIDYIFLRKNNVEIETIAKEVLWFKSDIKRTDKLNSNLSDHLAIKASFKWKNTK